MAVGFAVGTRGADHNRSGAYEVDFSPTGNRLAVDADAIPQILETEDKAALMDSLILCKFLRGVFADFFSDSAEMLTLTTGWDMTATELRAAAQRIVNLRKYFNILAGWQPAEDTLPERFFTESPADAPKRVCPANNCKMLSTHTIASAGGLRKVGFPTKSSLRLSIRWSKGVATELVSDENSILYF